MPTNPTQLPPLQRPYRLFALDDRVLAQNEAGKIIDIGAIEREGADGYFAKLDVDGITTPVERTVEAALKALQPLMTFDYLDGLFTSVAPTHPDVLLDSCPAADITLDEPVPDLPPDPDEPPHNHRF